MLCLILIVHLVLNIWITSQVKLISDPPRKNVANSSENLVDERNRGIFMRDRCDRKLQENKSIIVRTRKGNTVGCYHFITYGRNANNLPKACQHYASFDKAAERIEIGWNVGGDVFVNLYEVHPNGFTICESVIFDKKYVTAIEIETDFDNLREKGDRLCE